VNHSGSIPELTNLNWAGVLGQETAIEVLSQLILSNKIPHAFIFKGDEGVGKYNLAIQFAINVNSFYLPERADYISSQILSLTEPYIKYVMPLPKGKGEVESHGPLEKLNLEELQELKSELEKKIKNPFYKISLERANVIKINSIRDIGKFLAMNYSDVKFRFIIISEAHLMNEYSQNSLLKNLEEPPEGVIFILLTPYPELLKETIRSRCWSINLKPLANEHIIEILTKYFQVNESIAKDVSPFSDGSVTKALELIENDFQGMKDKTISFLRYSLGGKYNSAFNEINKFLTENDSDSIKLLIKMIISWMNDVLKNRLNLNDYYFESHKETIIKFNSRFADTDINSVIKKIDYLSSTIRNNVNLNTICYNLVFELASLTHRF